jgi:hypothetical protein
LQHQHQQKQLPLLALEGASHQGAAAAHYPWPLRPLLLLLLLLAEHHHHPPAVRDRSVHPELLFCCASSALHCKYKQPARQLLLTVTGLMHCLPSLCAAGR